MLRAAFIKAFNNSENPSDVMPFILETTSDGADEKYGWLGQAPSMSEWVDERRLKSLNDFDYTLKNKEILKPIELKYNQTQITYHYYELKGKQCIKLSYWYIMKINESQNLIPQTEEDIEQAVWTKTEIIPSLYGNMYESVIDVIESVI